MSFFYLFLMSYFLFSEEPIKHQHHGDFQNHVERLEVLGQQGEVHDLVDLVPSISYLSGEELHLRSQTTLGETLRMEPGINSTQFGPNASRPVIRGLGGDRIRILQNGVGVLDASGTSEDHAVPVAPLAVDAIEVVRGPIALLYGSNALGGVVNMVTSRIHHHYDEGFFSGLDYKRDSVNRGDSFAGKFDYGVKDWMFHVDGDYNRVDDLEVPLPQSKVINSGSERHSLAGGVTHFYNESDSLGLSYSVLKNNYGVVVEPDVTIQMQQERIDGVWRKSLSGFFESLYVRSVQSFYKHSELENGDTGTQFKNNGNETRLELVQTPYGALHGVLGLQWNQFDFSALGEEAFLPTTRNQSLALFAFEDIKLADNRLNFGARLQRDASKAEIGTLLSQEQSREFYTVNAALGFLHKIFGNFFAGMNLSYNERAPTYQELYSNGAHIATATYEVGDKDLQSEKALAAEALLRHKRKTGMASLSFFTYGMNDFINLAPTGAYDDTDESGLAGDSGEDLPIYNYEQTRARFWGGEFDFQQEVRVGLPGESRLRLTLDYVSGRDSNTGYYLPRLSPFRQSFEWIQTYQSWQWRLQWQGVSRQSHISPQERETAAYSLVNTSLSYQFTTTTTSWSIIVQGNNLFDEEARNHVSLLKDQVPLAGRNLSVGLRGYF
ncbi:MAG: TonB-dependent receptor [Bdellovibrionales bacterium]|nr:TonB-dependent receptor [Bdellovibrionales bacterium]